MPEISRPRTRARASLVLVLALVCVSLLATTAGGARADSVTLVDEQVNVIDYPIAGWLSVYNSSATYLVDGGQVGQSVVLYQFAWLEMSGGSVAYDLTAYTASEVYLEGGSVGDTLRAQTSASVDWSGGSVGGEVVAADNAVIRIYGAGFSVGGQPVPYGVLSASQGVLRGVLNDGTAIAVPFHHAGALYLGETVTGTIELRDGAPTQTPAPDLSHLVVLLNDGALHEVDDDRLDDHPLGVRVRSPLSATTLSVLPGARVGNQVVVSQDSVVDVSGGDVGFREQSCCSALYLTDQATLRLSGGVVHGRSELDQQARGHISGGTLTGEVHLSADSMLEITGGILGGPLIGYEDTHVVIEGGYLADEVRLWGTGVVRGGELGGQLIVEGTGDVEIVGRDFAIWGEPVALGEVSAYSGQLTGILENGDPLRVDFGRRQWAPGGGETFEGRLRLVPEPSHDLLRLAALAALVWMRGSSRAKRPARRA